MRVWDLLTLLVCEGEDHSVSFSLGDCVTDGDILSVVVLETLCAFAS